jgi:hypothetical protein
MNKIVLEKTFRNLEDKVLRLSYNIENEQGIVSQEEREIVEKFGKLCTGRSVSNNIILFFRLLESLIDEGFLGATYENNCNEIGDCKGNQ